MHWRRRTHVRERGVDIYRQMIRGLSQHFNFSNISQCLRNVHYLHYRGRECAGMHDRITACYMSLGTLKILAFAYT